jgi:hypothetical protein
MGNRIFEKTLGNGTFGGNGDFSNQDGRWMNKSYSAKKIDFSLVTLERVDTRVCKVCKKEFRCRRSKGRPRLCCGPECTKIRQKEYNKAYCAGPVWKNRRNKIARKKREEANNPDLRLKKQPGERW